MPSFIRVADQKFFSETNNGSNFGLNTSDFSRELKGGVGEKIRAQIDVEVTWYTQLDSFSVYTSNPNNFMRIEVNGNDFYSDGFSVGDSVKVTLPSATTPGPTTNTKYTGTIKAISTGEIEIDNLVLVQGTAFTNGYVANLNNGFLTGLTDLTALKYRFGLIENDEPFNTLSKLTNTEQIYLIDDINHGSPLTFSNGVSFGNNKAWDNGSIQVAYVQDVLDKDRNVPELTSQRFRIIHDFVITPYYRDGELDALKDIDSPPSDIFKGDRSLKYVFNTEFRTTLNSPNTSKNADYDTQKGSVGYFGESFNGYANDYFIDRLVYFNVDDSIQTDKVQIDKKTNVSFYVNSLSGTLSASTPFVVGHSALLDSLDYTRDTKTYNNLWLNETLRGTVAASPVAGSGIITNMTITNLNANESYISFDVEFTSDEQKQIENGQDYILHVTTYDTSTTVDTGDKVTNLIDVNVYEKSPDIAGLFDVEKLEQYPHPLAFDSGVSEGFTEGKMFVEDGQMLSARFKVLNTYLGDDLTLSEDVTLEALRFKIVVFNTITSEWFDLRELEIDISNDVVSGNVQNIELDSTRGYILKDDDIFNYLKLTTDNNDGTWQYYNLEVGYKIPWQDWLELEGADTIFYDKNLSNNGLNQNASRYMSLNDYTIRFLVDADVETIGVTTNYVKSSRNFTAFDRETDDQDPDAYTCSINTYDARSIELENNVIDNEFTEIRAVFTPVNPPTFTQSVDFTEVANDWNRFAHGGAFYRTFSQGANRLARSTYQYLIDNAALPPEPFEYGWNNDQANNINDDLDPLEDVFGGGATTFANKFDPSLYTSTPNQIQSEDNLNAFYGCYSLIEYEFYEITGEMYGNGSTPPNDDDLLSFVIAFNTDEQGLEHTLSLCATTGGYLLDTDPAYKADPDNKNINSIKTLGVGEKINPSWALVYNYGKRDSEQIFLKTTAASATSWQNANNLMFDVVRSGNDITIDVSWDIGGIIESETWNYNLLTNSFTEKFVRPQRIGFAYSSLDNSGFTNVDLTLPTSNYYGILRIETEDSPSDFAISELSTDIEAPESSLLKQITGDERKSTLAYDGTSFILQGLIETSKVTEGENYKFSGELRLRDLEL
jgi:hypothetical protein